MSFKIFCVDILQNYWHVLFKIVKAIVKGFKLSRV